MAEPVVEQHEGKDSNNPVEDQTEENDSKSAAENQAEEESKIASVPVSPYRQAEPQCTMEYLSQLKRDPEAVIPPENPRRFSAAFDLEKSDDSEARSARYQKWNRRRRIQAARRALCSYAVTTPMVTIGSASFEHHGVQLFGFASYVQRVEYARCLLAGIEDALKNHGLNLRTMQADGVGGVHGDPRRSALSRGRLMECLVGHPVRAAIASVESQLTHIFRGLGLSHKLRGHPLLMYNLRETEDQAWHWDYPEVQLDIAVIVSLTHMELLVTTGRCNPDEARIHNDCEEQKVARGEIEDVEPFMEGRRLYLGPGEVIVFRGDYLHAGGRNGPGAARLHWFGHWDAYDEYEPDLAVYQDWVRIPNYSLMVLRDLTAGVVPDLSVPPEVYQVDLPRRLKKKVQDKLREELRGYKLRPGYPVLPEPDVVRLDPPAAPLTGDDRSEALEKLRRWVEQPPVYHYKMIAEYPVCVPEDWYAYGHSDGTVRRRGRKRRRAPTPAPAQAENAQNPPGEVADPGQESVQAVGSNIQPGELPTSQ